MRNRFSRLATGLLAFAAIALVCGQVWAIYYALGPSKDEWGLKYGVTAEEAGADTVIKFTLADEGRLRPIHSVTLAILDKQNSTPNSQRFEVKGRLDLKPTADGKRMGQMQLRKDLVDRAMIRILTQRVDGRYQPSAAYYDIPVAKHLQEANQPGVATRPASPTKENK